MMINGFCLVAINLFSIILTIVFVKNYPGALIVALIIHFLWTAFTVIFIYYTYQAACSCLIAVLAYHDFLISYRQTPRSKILRRHLPQMQAIVEEASQYEASQISVSVIYSDQLASSPRNSSTTGTAARMVKSKSMVFVLDQNELDELDSDEFEERE